jgi:hypothetical protein
VLALAVVILSTLTTQVRIADATCVQMHWGDCIYTWGYGNRNNLGWLVPSNTTVFTQLPTNATIAGWIEGEVTIFPFQVESSTSTVVGLYVNGELVDTSTSANLSASSVGGSGGSCIVGICGSRIVRPISQNLATFTDWTWELDLYHTVGQSIPPGSTVAMAFETTKPLWISVNNQSSGFSLEVVHSSFAMLPASFPQDSQLSPYTVAAWVYSPSPSALGGPSILLWAGIGFIALCFIAGLIVVIVVAVARHTGLRKRTSSNHQQP